MRGDWVKCKYCGCDLPDEEGVNQEECPDKPFKVTLTRKEIWGLIDDYHLTKDEVRDKLGKLIGR